MGTKNEFSERHFIMDVVRNKITVSIVYQQVGTTKFAIQSSVLRFGF